MPGLIEEIQRDALDAGVPADTLLRKVKLAAGKLGLDDLEAWVEQELGGYHGELPSYRSIIAAPAAWNPYNGWIPVHSDSAEFMETISAAEIRQSIASLEDLLGNDSKGIHLPMPPQLVGMLNKMTDYQSAKVVWQISRGHIVNIISAVRNMTLDWAVEMEKKGVLGSGMSFKPEEKAQAQKAMTTIHIENVGSIVGNIGSHNSSGDIIVEASIISDVHELMGKLRAVLPTLASEGVDSERLSVIIDEVEKEVRCDTPKKGNLHNLLSDAKGVLIGAAGGVTAEGALALITSLMGMLIGG